MFNLKDLLPTKTEARKLFLEVWKYLLLAVLGGFALLVPTIRGLLVNRAHDVWVFVGEDTLVPGWLITALTLCATFTLIQSGKWVIRVVRRGDLFRSLSRNEQLILSLLAKSEFGLTEGELCDSVPVSPQHFLHFIDRLVKDLRLVERTETSTGGAFWALSNKGRAVAAANKLFQA